MTRSGKRDTSRVIEIRMYFDAEYRETYLSLIECLSPTLGLTKPFELLKLEDKDQIIQINGRDVRQSSPKDLLLILERLTANVQGDVSAKPSKEELLTLTYIKGKELQEKHLSKDQVMHCFSDP